MDWRGELVRKRRRQPPGFQHALLVVEKAEARCMARCDEVERCVADLAAEFRRVVEQSEQRSRDLIRGESAVVERLIEALKVRAAPRDFAGTYAEAKAAATIRDKKLRAKLSRKKRRRRA